MNTTYQKQDHNDATSTMNVQRIHLVKYCPKEETQHPMSDFTNESS